MLSEHTREAWDATPNADPDQTLGTVKQAGQWIKDRLVSGSKKSKSIDVLCIDTDGAVISWIKPEDATPEMIGSVIEGGEHGDPDDFDAPEHNGTSERFPDLPLEVSYEPLDGATTSVGARTAVIATPDVPARLLIDQLDERGIRVEHITTLWHAIAQAWDPGAARHGGNDAQRIVASSAPITGSIIVDGDKGLMVWTWSQGGDLIAGGSVRLTHNSGSSSAPTITESGIARLGVDWLGWSSQLGVSPARILFITPKPSTSATDEHAGLDNAGIGNALARAWPGASIDLIEHASPVDETLSQIARRGLKTTHTPLMDRPVRAHRSMYRWAGFSLIAASVAIGIGAWQFLGRAADTRDQISVINLEKMEMLTAVDPTIAVSSFPLEELRNKVRALRASSDPIVTSTSRPIMSELETLSFVVGVPGITINSIVINNFKATVIIQVPEIEIAEQIDRALEQIEGTGIVWETPDYKAQSGGIRATYQGIWDQEESMP